MTAVGIRISFSPDPARRELNLANAAALVGRGASSVRLRINWADIVPAEGRANARLVEELAEHAARLRTAGLSVWPTLCGNNLPGWFLNEGAFADTKATDKHWSHFVDTVAAAIADTATGWIPFETPIALATDGWLHGTRDPGIADIAKYADAVGGIVHSIAAVTRMLGESSTVVALDVAHAGANGELIGVFHEACVRGRLAIPGRVEREVAGLAGGVRGIGLSFPDRAALASSDALRRWRDDTVRATYTIAERFSPLPPSIVAVPDTASDDETSDLVATISDLCNEASDGGAAYDNVWLGDVGRLIGLPTDQALLTGA